MRRLSRLRFSCVLPLSAFLVSAAAGDGYSGDNVVATVNGKAIEREALTAGVDQKLPMASFHSRVAGEKLRKIQDEVLQSLIDEELLYQEAKRRNIGPDRAEVKRRIDAMKHGFQSDRAFKDALKKAGISRKELSSRMMRSLLIQEIVQTEIVSQAVVSDAEMKAYYEENQHKFVVPKRFRASHILVSVNPGAMAPGWQAGLEKAQELYKRLQAGSEFVDLAREASDDSTTSGQGGEMGWFHEGQLLAELEESLIKMNVGQVSKPIRTIYGFHLLKLEGTRPPKQLSFDQIDRESLKQKLLKRRQEQRREQFLADLRARANIKIFHHKN